MAHSYERLMPIEGWKQADADELDAVVSAVRAVTGFERRDCGVKNAAELRARLSWLSWGETVRIESLSGGVRLSSWCTFPFQVFDWGTNKRNVDVAEAAIANRVRQRRASASGH